MKPKALILHATGVNRDHDAACALELAGAQPEIVHVNQLRGGERQLQDYQMLVVPGGFSYADALGAGKLFAIDLQVYFAEEVRAFVASGKPVIGICNGFQVLVKSGILPGMGMDGKSLPATLTFNAGGHFECRWVTLFAQSRKCLWTRDLDEPITCPIAHGEGNFTLENPGDLGWLRVNDQIALVYARPDGTPALGQYPENPNGSIADIAGICNAHGNVLGLMPHPEDHIHAYQNPQRERSPSLSGLKLFTNGVNYARQM